MTVPLVDKTANAGSPFEIVAGEAVLTEVVEGNQLRSGWGDKLTLKNISEKPILLYVVSLQLIGRHNHGLRRGPGDGPTYILIDDRFFKPSVIRSGEILVVRDSRPGAGELECCLNPLERADEPSAEFRVLFVQFMDGSYFGDTSEAKDNFAIRSEVLAGLHELVRTYSQHGEQTFISEAEQHSAWTATSIFAEIYMRYKDVGAEGAIALAKQMLDVAENHRASIN
ncbi:MAG: hypothetical protein WCA20_19210 [Candidatus Sulfotelmatobacter sp.]